MKSITPSRVALARNRTLRAAADYTGFTASELIHEASQLHTMLGDCDQFGRAASLGIRHVVLDRLLAIDAEHVRRHAGTWPTAA